MTNIYSAPLAPTLVGCFRSCSTRFKLSLDSTNHVAGLANQPYLNNSHLKEGRVMIFVKQKLNTEKLNDMNKNTIDSK